MRAFLPPLALSLLSMAGYINLGSGFEWIGRWEVAVAFGLAAILEIVADKYPGVDNVLDGIGLFVKPLAGMLLATSMISSIDPVLGLALGVIVGGGVAGGVHVAKSKVRLASSAFTGGFANPVVSVAEDAGAITGVILAYLFPIAIIVLLVIGAIVLWRMKKTMKRVKEGSTTG